MRAEAQFQINDEKESVKMSKIHLTVVILTVFMVYSDAFLNETIHIRVKRGKYYSNPPQRFYRRPPNTHPVKGAFSYTPPPGYMMDEEDPYPGRPKVSRRPNDGLGEDDISNIVKYLSKQDLDKIIEIAAEKDRIRDNYIEKRPFKREESRIIKANVQEISDQTFPTGPYKTQETDKFNFNGPYRSQETDSQFSPNFSQGDQKYSYKTHTEQQFTNNYKPQENDQKFYTGPYAPNEDLLNYVEDATQSKIIYVNNNNNGYPNTPLQTEESMQNKQISYLNAYIHHEINDMTPGGGPANVYTDSQMMKEEELPKPLNLRDDFDISYTNNVPTVVKGPSYEVKNFGELPLMSNDYKLDTVSSYKVPHYTVTSNSKYGAPPSAPSSSSSSSSSSLNVPLEPAPPISTAKEQSDAHLKAIKIWTHRSKGTAYTLHTDGTLSLERPGRPKTKYGP